MSGPCKQALAIQAWIQKHDAVMTDDERKLAGNARFATDYIVGHKGDMPATSKVVHEKTIADSQRLVPLVEARLIEE